MHESSRKTTLWSSLTLCARYMSEVKWSTVGDRSSKVEKNHWKSKGMVYGCQRKSSCCACNQTRVKSETKAADTVRCKVALYYDNSLLSDCAALYDLMVQAESM